MQSLVVRRGGEEEEQVPWATLGRGGGSDEILAFKRMGVVKCRSPFGTVDCLGERRSDKRFVGKTTPSSPLSPSTSRRSP